MCVRHGRAAAVLLLPFSLGGAPIDHTAAPEVIILHGGVLDNPIHIADRRETATFAGSVTETASARDFADHSYVDVALFWGPVWAGHARDSLRLRALKPEQADQQARIYLARRSAEAPVCVFRRGAADARLIRRVSADGVRLLQRHNVPVYVDSNSHVRNDRHDSGR